jgi:hypothetical protein
MVRCQLLWLRGRQSFQPLRIQYQPSLLCQLLWLWGRQSFQPLRVQYQPSLLFQILMVRYAQQRRLVLDPQ